MSMPPPEPPTSLPPPPPPVPGGAVPPLHDAAASGPRCVVCGQTPAAPAEFNAHTGMLLVWRRSVSSGAFCRHCGTGVFRRQMNHTLAFGWFGLIAFFANFYAIGKNLLNRRRITALAPPPAEPPNVVGRPLFARYGVYVALGLLAVIATAIVVDIRTSDAEELGDRCIAIDGDTLEEVSCSRDHDARVVAVIEIDGVDQCPAAADDAFVLESDESHVLCVDFDR